MTATGLEQSTVITACDFLSGYITYVPIASRAWSRFSDANLRVVCVAPQDLHDDLARIINKHADAVCVDVREYLDLGVQAKIERLWQAQSSDLNSSFNVIMDMDLVPLSDVYQRLVLSKKPEALVKWRYDAYQSWQPSAKWPMHGTGAPGWLWQSLLNPFEDDLETAIERWSALLVDGKESPSGSFSVFSDESLLRAILVECGFQPEVWPISCDLVGSNQYAFRLDRADSWRSRSALKRLFPGPLIRLGRSQEFHGPSYFPHRDRRGTAILRFLDIDEADYGAYLAELSSVIGPR